MRWGPRHSNAIQRCDARGRESITRWCWCRSDRLASATQERYRGSSKSVGAATGRDKTGTKVSWPVADTVAYPACTATLGDIWMLREQMEVFRGRIC
jgi:hypothetical protein